MKSSLPPYFLHILKTETSLPEALDFDWKNFLLANKGFLVIGLGMVMNGEGWGTMEKRRNKRI
jgi:hypothetical protein